VAQLVPLPRGGASWSRIDSKLQWKAPVGRVALLGVMLAPCPSLQILPQVAPPRAKGTVDAAGGVGAGRLICIATRNWLVFAKSTICYNACQRVLRSGPY